MISPAIKDAIDLVASVGTVVGFLGLLLGFLYTQRDNKAKAKTAVDQINLMATNHFPHMEKDLTEQTKLITQVLEKHEKANEVLVSIDKGIAVLVDRGQTKITIEKTSL